MGCLWAQPTLSDIEEMIDREQYDRADQLLDERLEIESEDSEIYYWKGLVQYKMGHYQDAETAFEKGIDFNNKNPYNHAGLGGTRFQLRQRLGAIESLEKALKTKRRDIRVHFAVARAYLDEGSPSSLKEAEVLLLQAQKKAPDNPESYIALGDYYFVKKTLDLALIQYNQAIEKNPQFVQGYSRMGHLLIEKGRYEEAGAVLSKAMEIDPTYSPAYKYMGERWLKEKDIEKARANYQKYVELTDNDFFARQRYASFLFMAEDYQGVLDVLEGLDTTTILGWRLKGMAYLEMGNAEQAQACMSTYLAGMEAQGFVPIMWEADPRVFIDSDADRKAREEKMEEAYLADPAQAEVWNQEAERYRREGNYDQEVHYRTVYIEKKKKASIRDYYFLGIAQYRAAQFESADSTFAVVLSIKPDFAAAHFWRLRIAKSQDPENEQWLVIPHAQQIIKYLGDKPIKDLKSAEKAQLRTSYKLMIVYHYAEQADGSSNCEAARPWLEKALTIAPEDEYLLGIRAFCSP